MSSSNCHRHVRRLTFSRGLTRLAECGGDFPQQLQRRRCKFPTAPCAPKSNIKHQTSTIVIRKSSSNLRALRGIAVNHHFRLHSSINSSLSANHFNLTLHPRPSVVPKSNQTFAPGVRTACLHPVADEACLMRGEFTAPRNSQHLEIQSSIHSRKDSFSHEATK